MKTKSICVVVATRAPTLEDFFDSTPTGRSLASLRHPDVIFRVFEMNKRGLANCYNRAIAEIGSECPIFVFAHDDLLLLDFHWPDSLRRALEEFDIVGVAGNRRRVPNQPAWFLLDDKFTWDSPENLSGTVAHGNTFPPSDISVYGPSAQEVVLLDGLFLAVKSETLAEKDLSFDESFDFHFYDMDFCREAELRGLRMGTWPISIVHASGGKFMSDSWKQAYQRYLEKWGS